MFFFCILFDLITNFIFFLTFETNGEDEDCEYDDLQLSDFFLSSVFFGFGNKKFLVL